MSNPVAKIPKPPAGYRRITSPIITPPISVIPVGGSGTGLGVENGIPPSTLTGLPSFTGSLPSFNAGAVIQAAQTQLPEGVVLFDLNQPPQGPVNVGGLFDLGSSTGAINLSTQGNTATSVTGTTAVPGATTTADGGTTAGNVTSSITSALSSIPIWVYAVAGGLILILIFRRKT